MLRTKGLWIGLIALLVLGGGGAAAYKLWFAPRAPAEGTAAFQTAALSGALAPNVGMCCRTAPMAEVARPPGHHVRRSRCAQETLETPCAATCTRIPSSLATNGGLRTGGLMAARARPGGRGACAAWCGGRPPGRPSGLTLAYRADMDALPIQEVPDRLHASLALGVSHAQASDAHVAMASAPPSRWPASATTCTAAWCSSSSLLRNPARRRAGDDRRGPAGPLRAGGAARSARIPAPGRAVGAAEDRCLAGMEEFHVRF